MVLVSCKLLRNIHACLRRQQQQQRSNHSSAHLPIETSYQCSRHLLYIYIQLHGCLHLVEFIVTAVPLPLLQALTTSVAFWYGLEAFKLRGEMVQEEVSRVEARAWLVSVWGSGVGLFVCVCVGGVLWM
jgi:hypothetical protein